MREVDILSEVEGLDKVDSCELSDEEILLEIESGDEQPEEVDVKVQQERDMWRERKAGTSLELCGW